jgi:hypothetical protein
MGAQKGDRRFERLHLQGLVGSFGVIDGAELVEPLLLRSTTCAVW